MKDDRETAGCINWCVHFQGRLPVNHEDYYRKVVAFMCKSLIEIIPTNGLSGVSPPRKSNNFSASKIPRIVWNPKVNYRIHKSTPLVYVLNQTHKIYILPTYF